MLCHYLIDISCPCPWLPAVLQELLCHTFQRMLIEPEEPVRLLLWQVIVVMTHLIITKCSSLISSCFNYYIVSSVVFHVIGSTNLFIDATLTSVFIMNVLLEYCVSREESIFDSP